MASATTEVRACSIARTLNLIGEKWSLLAIRELMLDNRRFEEIVRRTGAPRDILTTRLRKLEDSGLIERVQYQDRPARYEYLLTALGWSLLPVVTVLRDWGDQHLAGAEGPPVRFEHECGATLTPEVVCGTCGNEVTRGSLAPVPNAD